MSFLVERDEDTAALRRVPMRLFTSDGTTPDTGAAGDDVQLSVNGAATITASGVVVAVDATDGMYYVELTQSETSVLGSLTAWHDDGAFAQHFANVQVVNFNPMSSQSNVPLVATVTDVTNQVTADATAISGDATAANNLEAAFDGSGYVSTLSVIGVTSGVTVIPAAYSGVTVGVDDIAPAAYSGVTVGIDDIALAAYSGVTVGIDNIALAAYSGVTFGVDDIAPGDYSGATVGAGDIAEAVYSGVTVRVDPITYSGLTVGIDNVAPAAYSGVTVGIDNIAPAVHSGVTVQINNISSLVTLADGGLTAAKFAAGAVDAAALATDAVVELADGLLDRDMATGADSGSSAVRTARDALRALRNRVVLSGNTMTVYEEDDVTAKWTASLVTTGDSNFPTAVDPNS